MEELRFIFNTLKTSYDSKVILSENDITFIFMEPVLSNDIFKLIDYKEMENGLSRCPFNVSFEQHREFINKISFKF